MSRGPLIRTSKNRINLSRRTFLRGVLGGSALALAVPTTLEVMLNSHGTAYADGTSLPQRFVLWYWGNGVVTNKWLPSGTGTGYTLSPALQPFANVKDYLSVVSGLAMPFCSWAHYTGAGLLLTGDNPDGLGTVVGGPARRESFDQTIAKEVSGSTPFKSVQVGIAYYSHGGTSSNLMIDSVSHSGPGSALRAEQDPSAVFERLFGGNFTPPSPGTTTNAPVARDVARGRMLDAVKQDATRLRARLGKGDQDRLDAHLSAIADLQRRLTPTAHAVAAECRKPDLGNFSTYSEKTNVMNEVIRLALACDLTRVVSYMFSSPASHREYPEVNINSSFHADVCHQEPAPQTVYETGVKYFMERFASLLDAFKNTPEGTGNMLDNICAMGTSCIATQTEGGAHSVFDWPILFAGRAGGKLRPGMHYRSTSNGSATMASLTAMRAMGLTNAGFGYDAAYTDQTLPILT